MNWLVLGLWVVLTATVSMAQPIASTPDPSRIEVMRFSWTKERIGWERDPFGGPIENFDEVRARTRNERRIDDAKRGGSAEVDKIKREAKADAANMAVKHKATRSRYVFVYRTTVKNLSDKQVKSVDWDYVFFDRATETEIGRRQFTSEEKIAPGKSKELTVTITKPPTQTISLTALNTSERNALIERVVVVRVNYTDGSSWQLPE
jgi:hypothetical protein